MIHLEARKLGLAGLPKDQLPKAGEVMRKSGHLTIPVIAIVALLLYGFTPLYAAFFTILITVAVSYIKKDTAIGIAGILRALEGGARSAIGVAMACAVVGFVVGVSSLTSLGLTFGANIIDLSGNNLMLMLVLTAITALILGMGLPTPPATSSPPPSPPRLWSNRRPAAGRPLLRLLLRLPLQPHPACLPGLFHRRRHRRRQPLQSRLDLHPSGRSRLPRAFPRHLFAYAALPGQLQHGVTGRGDHHRTVGVVALSAALENWLLRQCTIIERLILFCGSMGLIIPGFWTDIFGLGGVAAVYLWQNALLLNLRRSVPSTTEKHRRTPAHNPEPGFFAAAICYRPRRNAAARAFASCAAAAS
jgi:hypothetical protein